MVRVEFGKARCRFHGGLSTGPKTEAGRARIAEHSDGAGVLTALHVARKERRPDEWDPPYESYDPDDRDHSLRLHFHAQTKKARLVLGAFYQPEQAGPA
jgi:hypothetical protein